MEIMECKTSLVPRPHPLTRRNSVVDQVEFLGLVHTFATVSPTCTCSNVQDNLTISLAFPTFGEKLDFVHQIVSDWDTHAGWA